MEGGVEGEPVLAVGAEGPALAVVEDEVVLRVVGAEGLEVVDVERAVAAARGGATEGGRRGR
jgi:hypothetical protein